MSHPTSLLAVFILITGCAANAVNTGLEALNRGDLNTAEAHFNAGVQQGDPAAFNNLGVIAERRGQMELAVNYYTLAARYGVSVAIQNLIKLGRPVPEPDLANARAAAQASNAANAAATLQLMNALQPRPAPRPTVNCSSYRIGNTIQTDCR